MNNKKWFTCTPVAFKGDHTFFHRDSGLFCKAFQEIGIESKAVMPLPSQEGDWPDLIRTEYKNLESADWWRSLDVTGVLLYSWGVSRYTSVARAIHQSGAKLVIYMDTGSAVYPWEDWTSRTKLFFRVAKYRHGRWYPMHALASILWAHSLGLANYPRRRAHLGYADIIGLPTSYAVDAYKRVPFLLSDNSKKRIRFVPCPIAWHFRYNSEITKEPRIIAVGRWDDEEPKRPRYMMEAIEQVCQQNDRYVFDIFGHIPAFMQQWHKDLPESQKARIVLHGIVPNQLLVEYYQKARVCLCPSMHESTHLASAEAICCGCSVVVANTPFLRGVHWYTSENSGTVAPEDTPTAFAAAIEDEMHSWAIGKRDPTQISNHWTKRLHATNTARNILAFFEPPSCN